ncbi:MAG: hypothetical protein QNJ16_21165 [Rhodobacter sp.]|nr:hypothetical protein [Gammaproteobacteria bacterium]MDJ0828000.1 hypothetical protein [Rhodobacter sp.]
MRRAERPLTGLPKILLAGLGIFFLLQVLFHQLTLQQLAATYRPLGQPLSSATYRQLSMGSEQLTGYLLAISLQLHDNQAGQHFSYRLIDYDRLIAWLDRATELSPGTEYPLLLAARIYTQTGDRDRLHKLLAFIERRFDEDPQRHWRRMTEACLIAKHKLQDLELALQLAEKIANQPASVVMPHWARDFRFLLLAELNEFESAIAVIQALLETDAVDDPDERRFLLEKLSDFQQKLFESQQNPPG